MFIVEEVELRKASFFPNFCLAIERRWASVKLIGKEFLRNEVKVALEAWR